MKIIANTPLFEKLAKTNLLPLAFIGDGVHTLFVRERILVNLDGKMENYHTNSSRFCKASTQARALRELMPSLREDEQEIVRRGRNAKPKHTAKNSSSADYSYATAFEILVGYLYLKGEEDRLNEVLEKSMLPFN